MTSVSAQATQPSTQTRRRDLDVMRAVVVLGLVFFHSARIFSFDPFYVSNDQQSLVLSAFVALGVLWGMPLMFLISGQTTWFSLASRNAGQFVLERFQRLMIPVLFGLLVFVPPHLYCWLRADPAYQESYLKFYPRFFQVVPKFDFPWFIAAHPSSMLFEVAHLWFLYYLLAFTLLLLPLFLYLRRDAGAKWITRLASFCERPGAILVLGLPVGVIEAALQSENYGGWNRYAYLLFLVYGYLMAGDPRFARAIRRHGLLALLLVMPATALGFTLYARAANVGVYLGRGYALGNVLWRVLKGVGAWWSVVAILGLGGRWLQHRADGWQAGHPSSHRFLDRVLEYANEAVLPFYVLHETVVVVIGFSIVKWQASVWVKYWTISLVSLGVTLALYEFLVRRTAVTRFLFGMKPQRPARY